MKVTPPRHVNYVVEMNGRENWLIQQALRELAVRETDPGLRILAIEMADKLRENA